MVLSTRAQSPTGLDRIYRELAAKCGGSYSAGGWFGRPSVRFRHRDVLVAVDMAATWDGGENSVCTRVLLQWPDPDIRCEVFSSGAWSRFGRFVGMQDIEIGSVDFDRDYIISGNDRDSLVGFLSNGVQVHIDRVRYVKSSAGVYLSVNRGTFLVRKRGVIRNESILELFVMEVLDLYDQALLTLTKGIEFVGVHLDDGAEDAICQICGERMDDDIVFCRRCKTPHHLDCWQYLGSCSTYGCSESKYLSSRKIQRLRKTS